MELIFGTRNYASKLSKSADIESDDPVQPKVKIMFTAEIIPGPDSQSICRHSPDIVEFEKGKQKSQSAVFSNHGNAPLRISMVSVPPKELDVKTKPFDLKPTEIKKLDFKWKGTYAEKDSNLSLTFEIKGDSTSRFTIPVLIKGTKPPEPKLTQKELPKQPATPPQLKEPVPKGTPQTAGDNKWPIQPDSTRPNLGPKK